MQRTTRMLYGLAGLLLLVGLALRIAPAPLPASQGSTDRATRSRPVPQQGAREVAGADGAIVSGNIFSVSRSAPRVRYSPPDLAPTGEPRRRVLRPAAAGLKLFGTVSGTAALIDANPAVPGAEIYQVGEKVRGKRVVAVTESTVVLDGPGGRTVLRLQPAQQPTR
jgi:hypothetical protein